MSSFWKHSDLPILASTSATRRDLLLSARLTVEAVGSHVEERPLEAALLADGATPQIIALELAKAKAQDVARRYPKKWIIAADQTLALGARQFHKPASISDAGQQLQLLAGQTHHLHSAVVCYFDQHCRFEHLESASLTMRNFGPDFLQTYLSFAGDSVTRSVGGYQVEGLGVHLFEKIEGHHSTILGLPLLPLLSFFRGAGLLED